MPEGAGCSKLEAVWIDSTTKASSTDKLGRRPRALHVATHFDELRQNPMMAQFAELGRCALAQTRLYVICTCMFTPPRLAYSTFVEIHLCTQMEAPAHTQSQMLLTSLPMQAEPRAHAS